MIDKEQIVLYDVLRIGEVSSRFKVDIAKHMKYCNEADRCDLYCVELYIFVWFLIAIYQIAKKTSSTHT
jgi:hypothetical protein